MKIILISFKKTKKEYSYKPRKNRQIRQHRRQHFETFSVCLSSEKAISQESLTLWQYVYTNNLFNNSISISYRFFRNYDAEKSFWRIIDVPEESRRNFYTVGKLTWRRGNRVFFQKRVVKFWRYAYVWLIFIYIWSLVGFSVSNKNEKNCETNYLRIIEKDYQIFCYRSFLNFVITTVSLRISRTVLRSQLF